MNGTTAPTDTAMVESENYSSAQAKRSFFAPPPLTLCSYGEPSSTTAGRTASTAPCSATSHHTAARTSFAKRAQLLMRSGLIAGITPTSIAKRSPQRTLDIVFSPLDGDVVDTRKVAC